MGMERIQPNTFSVEIKEEEISMGMEVHFYKPEPLEVSIQRFRQRRMDIPCENDEERSRFSGE